MLLLAACASDEPAPVEDLSENAAPPERAAQAPVRSPDSAGIHHVVSGDTLYAIAFRNGLDYRDVAAWNNIAAPYRIYVGQVLRLFPPGGSAPAVAATTTGSAPRSVVAAPPPAAAAAPPPSPAPVAPPPKAATSAMFEDVPPEPAAPPAAEKPVAATPAPSSPAAPALSAPPTVKPGEAPAKPAMAENTASPPARAIEALPSKITEDSVATTVNGLAWRWPGKGTLAGTYVAGDQTRQGIDIAGKAGDPVLAAGDGEVVYSGNGLLGYGELIIVKHNASFLSAYGHNRKRLVQEGDKVKAGQQIAEMGSSAASRDELHFEIRKNGKPVNPLDYLPAR
jgi:lipoprotein NlpD